MRHFQNPIIKNSPKSNTSDPYVLFHDGFYYHCYSNSNGVFVAQSETLWDIDSGKTVMVYDCNMDGALRDWFAPELHRIGEKWYIYAAPDYGDFMHVMTALVCDDPSPMGEYKNCGIIKGLEGKWTIDGTVLNYDGELYFVYTNCRKLYISKMSDPLTLCGEEKVLSKPEFEFETKVGLINEGPAVLYHGNKIHIVYSANDSKSDEYCLGLLTFKVGGDILDMKNWIKKDRAVFKKTYRIFGPGHCSFTTVNEDGRDVITSYTMQISYQARAGTDGMFS